MTIKKELLRIEETAERLGCSKKSIYNLLSDGKLQAHNPRGVPGTRGTKIVAASVDKFIRDHIIPTDKWNE